MKVFIITVRDESISNPIFQQTKTRRLGGFFSYDYGLHFFAILVEVVLQFFNYGHRVVTFNFMAFYHSDDFPIFQQCK